MTGKYSDYARAGFRERVLLTLGILTGAALTVSGLYESVISPGGPSYGSVLFSFPAVGYLWCLLVSCTLVLAFASVFERIRMGPCRPCPVLILSANATLAVSVLVMGLLQWSPGPDLARVYEQYTYVLVISIGSLVSVFGFAGSAITTLGNRSSASGPDAALAPSGEKTPDRSTETAA